MREQELRERFVNYFESKGHEHLPSSALVPHNDPTLLFTNAGMVQFKDIFTGMVKTPNKRAVTVQKCVRAGGKHNDLDTVGRTARHHTFFEMLGNFSFGDYFKEDAINFAWEFLTEVMELPEEKLYITVHYKDDEARELWKKRTGFSDEKIFGLGDKDNFWSMGDTGPCGPCSEIFFDRGEKYSCDAEECGIGKCDCDRYMEIWNLVFMQYERDKSGTMTPLPNPSIDTGMGLERMISIINEVDSNYEIPIMAALIAHVEKITNSTYDAGNAGFPYRVIADHLRSCSFLISDGVIPGNEGRSYVLRRILRRAVLFGKNLGLEKPFLCEMVPLLAELMGETYPVLREQQEFIAKVIRIEEEKFYSTINDGLGLVDEILAGLKAEGKTVIAGSDAFQLYDTYGFPLDLTIDIAEEKGFSVDADGFKAAMEAQRERARAARSEATGGAGDIKKELGVLLADMAKTEFIGYEVTTGEAQVLAIIENGQMIEIAGVGTTGYLVLDKTPFYGESGGQVGDTGVLTIADGVKVEILDTIKLVNGVYLHQFEVTQGILKLTDEVLACVDETRRMAIARNHSATHILQSALREVLGSYIQQKGSYVNAERLRFDFSHISAMTVEEINQVEAKVNAILLANVGIDTCEVTMDEAREMGALAFFGDKYGSKVRVVAMGEASIELCGGTHASRTGDIGLFKIVSEAGIGSGTRRIEAVTGINALNWWQERLDKLEVASKVLKTSWQDIDVKIAELQEESREKDREIAKLKSVLQGQELAGLIDEYLEIEGVKVFAKTIDVADMNELRDFADKVKDKLVSCVVLLAAVSDGKVMLVASVTKDLLAKKMHAGNIVKVAAGACGGGGGGRPDMAQAGGKDVTKVDEAISSGIEEIKKQLSL